LLRNHLPELLENVDLPTRQKIWFQQDGAAPHYVFIARAFLNDYDRWIGREGPVAWPPCSSDLTRFLFVGILEKCYFCSTDHN